MVQRPPEVVFDFVATHRCSTSSRPTPSKPPAVGAGSPPDEPDLAPAGRAGTTARVVRRHGRRRVEGTSTVLEHEPDRRRALGGALRVLLTRPAGRAHAGRRGNGDATTADVATEATRSASARDEVTHSGRPIVRLLPEGHVAGVQPAQLSARDGLGEPSRERRAGKRVVLAAQNERRDPELR
jgi:hypothetical protein